MGNIVKPDVFEIKNKYAKFEVILFHVKGATQCILFAPGRGGSPRRHLGLLQNFALHGISVVAPDLELLTSPSPTRTDLAERSQRLALAEKTFCAQYDSITGVGHSLGTVILLMHAGATAWTSTGDPVCFEGRKNLKRLVLMAPPADFFRTPISLASVKIPVQIWAGEKDTVTPPSQASFLKTSLGKNFYRELHIVENCGHFTFMNTLPPHVTDPHPSREAFLLNLGEKISKFILNQ